MSERPTDKLLGLFYDFLHTEKYEVQLSNETVFVDHYDLDEFSVELATHVLNDYKWMTKNRGDGSGRPNVKDFKLVNLIDTTPIRMLEAQSTQRILQIEGVVIQRNNPLIRATKVMFECLSCGYEIKVTQRGRYRKEPDQCDCEGRKWRRVYEKSEFVNYQEIFVQELMENAHNGSSPDKIKVVLTNELIRSCEAGEQVVIVGYMDAYDDSYSSKALDLQYHLHAHSIVNTTDRNLILLSEEDRHSIQEHMKSPDHLDNIIASIAPSIYGLDEVKKALALQQCEGQVKIINRIRKRGQFHILLAGPPGVAKSELGDFMVKCHPKGRKAIGRGASGVGLTASVVKDGEQFVLRAGAMPRADNGFLFIDEIEKMSQQDSGAMHPGMEQQVINIDKADISAELKTRCSILAACNPLGGVWDDYKTTVGNLNEKGRGLALPLLDRFALIFIIKQNLESNTEKDIVDHIISTNESENVTPPYTVEELHRIFAYARTLKVKLTAEVGERLKEFYMVLYEASKQDSALIISRRQIQDLIRLAEASARLHGRTETTLDDAEAAVSIVATSLEQYGVDPSTGKIDQGAALYGKPMSRLAMIAQIPEIITRVSSRNIDKSRLSRVEFIKYAMDVWTCTESDAGDLLMVALRDGLVYCPTPATLAVSV